MGFPGVLAGSIQELPERHQLLSTKTRNLPVIWKRLSCLQEDSVSSRLLSSGSMPTHKFADLTQANVTNLNSVVCVVTSLACLQSRSVFYLKMFGASIFPNTQKTIYIYFISAVL